MPSQFPAVLPRKPRQILQVKPPQPFSVVRTVTQGSAEIRGPATGSESCDVTESATVSNSIAVGLDTVRVSESAPDVAKTPLSVTADQVDAASIFALARGIPSLWNIQRILLQRKPRDSAFPYRDKSVTPGVCLAFSRRVTITQFGLCLVSIDVVDSLGNS